MNTKYIVSLTFLVNIYVFSFLKIVILVINGCYSGKIPVIP